MSSTSTQSDEGRKRLTRPLKDRTVAGVCSGIANYWHIDPTWVRIGYATLAVLTKIVPFAILYLVLIIVIPKSPDEAPE